MGLRLHLHRTDPQPAANRFYVFPSLIAFTSWAKDQDGPASGYFVKTGWNSQAVERHTYDSICPMCGERPCKTPGACRAQALTEYEDSRKLERARGRRFV
jgi:hypothetical protein